MLRLYDFLGSGNCYKVRLVLTQLGIPFERIELDFRKRETRTPEFLSKNPNGHVPVLETEPGQFLWESNAIMFYLSQNTRLLPNDPFEQAQLLQWLFFEQYSLMPYIAVCRYWITILDKADEHRDAINEKRPLGYAALMVLEQHLTSHTFFVGGQYTIADIGLFAYTHVAHEGGFDMTKFPAIQTWIERVKSQPKYIAITKP